MQYMKYLKPRLAGLTAAMLCLITAPIGAGDFEATVPMLYKGAATYYVDAQLADSDIGEFMVDTGSGYLTINENTLTALKVNDRVRYVKDLSAILADGSRLVVPVYTVSRLRIGAQCTLYDVEAAVFPGSTRQILGLSALNKAAPFIFSVNPPQLVLSNCIEPAGTDQSAALAIVE
jgi:predicted aspartyl protease